tara:strand:+ start:1507 stop:2229 length:723 start_codon:yes stop_codon:yes gene_type:complete
MRNLTVLALILWFGVGSLIANDPLVINAGIGGNSTEDLLKRLEKDVLSLNPSLVALMVGTNDMLNSRKSVPLDQYQANLNRLVQSITESGAKLVLMTIPPCNERLLLTRHPAKFFEDLSPAERIDAANIIIRSFGNTNSVRVVDVHQLISGRGHQNEKTSLLRNEANSRSKDGVHPTAEAYELIAEAIYLAMQKADWTKARPIICFGDSITFGSGMKGSGTAASDAETYPARLASRIDSP